MANKPKNEEVKVLSLLKLLKLEKVKYPFIVFWLIFSDMALYLVLHDFLCNIRFLGAKSLKIGIFQDVKGILYQYILTDFVHVNRS